MQQELFPVEQLLKLYSKHSKEFLVRGKHNRLYLNYFEEFKLLIQFLGPFSVTVPSHVPRMAWYEGNYEIQELAKHLKMEQHIVLYILRNLDHEH